jgi:histone acetyltransferase SAS3
VDANAPPARRRASAPKLARDLLPSQKGRKRKTSSAEADEDILALRKKRKNTMESTESANEVEDSARSQSGRPVRIKIMPATIQKRTRSSIIIKMKVDPSELRTILSRKPKGLKKRDRKTRGGSQARRRSEASRSAPAAPPSPTAPFASSAYTQPFYSFFDKETDETKGKPYGGILTETEADTSRTMPTNDDRRRFDEAKQKAEEEWKERLRAMQADVEAPVKKSKKSSGPASQIECINFGGWEIDTWYAAPYPEEYSRHRVLYICEFCLKYMNSDYVAWRHKLKCPAKHPPGDEIYRHGSVSVFEVDGRKNPVYCQNLCLLAKLFLGSKTLYYDVEPFLFYVLCEYDELGYHFVGYFSKEKRASSQNNVSCILTLPIHQRKGYATLLIDFSYLLTRVEQKTGSPEKPLSDMGLVSYRNYWRLIICRYFVNQVSEDKTVQKGLSINQISEDTGLTPDDVVAALEGLRCLVRDPETKLYAFRVDLPYCREYVAKWESKKYVQLRPSSLTWTPYVMGRSNATNFELGPAITAIAPREDDEEHKTAAIAGENLGRQNDPAEQTNADNQSENKEVPEPMVLESTEPNETGADPDDAKVEEDGANGASVNGEVETSEQPEDPEVESADKLDDWVTQYRGVPASRFEVYPPITGRKADRVRTAPIGRPPILRTPSTAPRVRPRPRANSGRKSSSSKPRSSSARKPGGTGRGPGRWPKGTKKSDYGNADSGPGFPPGWKKEHSLLSLTNGSDVGSGKEKEVGDPDDTVEVLTPKINGSKSPSKRNGSSGEASSSKSRSTPRSSHGAVDVVMADADEDAEGEEADD